MKANYEAGPIRASRITAYLAAFALALVLSTAALHRVGVMSTPVAMVNFVLSFALALAALLAGGVAGVIIWRTGENGFARTLVGVMTAIGILAWPVSQLPAALSLPRINDVTTDTKSPPRLVALAKQRDRAANPAAYPGERAASLQLAAYPDLQPLFVDRSAEDAFELVKDVLRREHRMRIVAEDPPGTRPGEPGVIEAVDRTLLLGFNDDVIVRVAGDQRQARIDVRSASRFGTHDLGRNAARTRRLLKDFQARLETMLPGGGGMAQRRALLRAAAAKAPVPKRSRDGEKAGPQKAGSAKGQGRPSAAKASVTKETAPRSRPPKGGFE